MNKFGLFSIRNDKCLIEIFDLRLKLDRKISTKNKRKTELMYKE